MIHTFKPGLHDEGRSFREILEERADGYRLLIRGGELKKAPPYQNTRTLREVRAICSGRIINGERWVHISVSRADYAMPGWYEIKTARNAILGPDSEAVQAVPKKDEHWTIQDHANSDLPGAPMPDVAHVWHCMDRRVMPVIEGAL